MNECNLRFTTLPQLNSIINRNKTDSHC